MQYFNSGIFVREAIINMMDYMIKNTINLIKYIYSVYVLIMNKTEILYVKEKKYNNCEYNLNKKCDNNYIMDISCCDKIIYYWHYFKHKNSSKKYKSIIVLNNDGKIFFDATEMFNSKVLSQETFNEPKKVIFRCEDEKEFNVSFFAKSYVDIKNKIKIIIANFSSYSKKIKTVFPNFIENVYLIKDNENNNLNNTSEEECKIDIKNIIDECIEYEKNAITFFDIALLLGEKIESIKKLKIIYVKSFRKIEKEFNFTGYMNNDIEVLNLIYE